METQTQYNASSIAVLEGLEPVRKRPGMYIGGTGSDGLHHLIWEIVDNAIDEAINGYASQVSVTLHKDNQSISVQDNGRGIPVDIHPKAGVPALQVILTTLHAGGKFDSENYITSGGLHGVGSSVVNALSSSLTATVRRNGFEWQQSYRRGKAISDLEKVKEIRGSGTKISFTPDNEIFDDIDFDSTLIKNRLEISAYLNSGLKIIFINEAKRERTEFQFSGGVSDFLTKEIGSRNIIAQNRFVLNIQETPRVDIALSWTDHTSEMLKSFVNGIPTRDGGTHEQGLRDAVLKAVRSYLDTNNVSLPRGVKLSAEDIREGLMAICSIFLTDPQFQGQTKDRLNNPEARSLIESIVRPALQQWLLSNKSTADALIGRMIMASRARAASRAANAQVRRKSAVGRRLNLPGKLADCSSSDAESSEIFIVEGDSAGGSAKQGRDRKTQAILPLRGKVLNAEQATLKKVLANRELSDIVSALGCGLGKDFNIEHLRYHKIILLMDADQDGHHIATLLLTFFYRYMPSLINNGHVYLAQPPLYRIDIGQKTKWASDDAAKNRILKSLPPRSKPQISRFKGLGEMMPKTLYNTTLNPKKRKLLKVCIPENCVVETDALISELMGKDTQARYVAITQWMNVIDNIDF